MKKMARAVTHTPATAATIGHQRKPPSPPAPLAGLAGGATAVCVDGSLLVCVDGGVTGHCTSAPAAFTWVATARPHSESHGVTGTVSPVPLTALSNATVVLDFIHTSPSAGGQAPRPLGLEDSRVLRLAVVPLISEEEGSCSGGHKY